MNTFFPVCPARSRLCRLTALLLICGWLTTPTHAQTWAKSFGGTNQDIGYAVAVDAAGNVYTTGRFGGTVDFDPGAGVASLTAAGPVNAFVSKFDASGNYVWAKAFACTQFEFGYGIAVDATGNVYTTGYFFGTADFDPGAGVASLTSVNWDIFVSKLDASGNYVWAKALGGSGFDNGQGIALDATGNVYTTGTFEGTADFDPGAGVANLTSAGNKDVFVSKLDASGNYVWARRFGGSVSDDIGYGIAVDATGNVHTSGSFFGTADFDPGAGVANLTANSTDIFVSKLNASGNYVWAKALGGTNQDFGFGIALDATGNVYTTGYFAGTADFDPGAGVANLISGGGDDIFVSKLDASGNYVWGKALGGTGGEVGYGIAVDATGNVHTTGSFAGTADFDPGLGVANLTAGGIFVSKLDASGSYVWGKALGGTGGEVGYGIAVDATGNVCTTGSFGGTGDFDPGPGILNLTWVGGNDVFVSKLNASGSLPVTLRYFSGRMTDGGALLGWATAREDNNAHFQVERSRDVLAFESIATIPTQAVDGNSATELTYSYLDSQPLPGINYYRLVQIDRDGTRTTSKIVALSREGQASVLFPNPISVSGEAAIEPGIAHTGYQISDVLGRVVQRVDAPGVLSQVSLIGLPAGVYMLRVQTDSGLKTWRVLR
jgi:hypothetical protein